MAKTYIQLRVHVYSPNDGGDIGLAGLSDVGFESFLETPEGLEAYIPLNEWSVDSLDVLSAMIGNGIDLSWSLCVIPPENWNAVWESDFQPIVIENQCAVRADFHAPIDVPFELLITPKMSFGTGHHQTTFMMLNYLLKHRPSDHKVLDMGCGTGVLGILAEKLGANHIDAIDVEPWCYENTVENAQMNNCQLLTAYHGDVNQIPGKQYDTILANINMNVLLLDIPKFAQLLSNNGHLFLSGFFTQDIPAIEAKANQNGLHMIEFQERDRWVAAHFTPANAT